MKNKEQNNSEKISAKNEDFTIIQITLVVLPHMGVKITWAFYPATWEFLQTHGAKRPCIIMSMDKNLYYNSVRVSVCLSVFSPTTLKPMHGSLPNVHRLYMIISLVHRFFIYFFFFIGNDILKIDVIR